MHHYSEDIAVCPKLKRLNPIKHIELTEYIYIVYIYIYVYMFLQLVKSYVGTQINGKIGKIN